PARAGPDPAPASAAAPAVSTTVDGDGGEHREAPAEQRYPQQLLLEDPDLWREDDLECQRFPRRLVLREDDERPARHALHAPNDVAYSTDPLRGAHDEPRPE